ncbi:MAG TPA: hypothetical protein VK445_06650 [Dissulfurispiraceae bacterium]|nr:hypothetical protein [Dissulfurispiraceae bacterium]
MNIWAAFFGSLLFLMSLVLPAGAAQRGGDFDSPERLKRMQQFRERVAEVRDERMRQALQLDDRSSRQVGEINRRYEQRRMELRQAAHDDMRELQGGLKSRNESTMRNTIDRLEQRQQAIQKTHSDERAELRRTLTTEQQAKYILFQHAFQQEMRDKLRDIRQRKFKER